MSWTLPPNDLLTRSGDVIVPEDRTDDLLHALALLGATSNEDSVQIAPQAVRYELTPCSGVRMKAYRGIDDDLMQMLGIGSVRIEAPSPGRTTVGVEIPRAQRATIHLGDVAGAAQGPLRAAVGVDMEGKTVTLSLADYPHLLVAGRSGGGKSVLLHNILCSLLTTHTPDELELILIDPKSVEAAHYEGLPHASNITYDPDHAVDVLWGMVNAMETTYNCMLRYGARSLDELNLALVREGADPIPRRLCVIDEMADLVMRSRARVESAIVRLGQKGRAAGFHLILATQTPRKDVVSGIIKANLTARIALATASALDSRIILDANGAEALLGQGDALLDDGLSGTTRRFQSAYASTEDVRAVVDWWAGQTAALVAV